MTSDERPVNWSRRWSLAYRILAVNLFALVSLSGSVFYLDSFRDRLLEERTVQAQIGASLAADALGQALLFGTENGAALAARLGSATKARIRVYGASGALIIDSWTRTGATFELRDPETEPWRKDAARWLDRVIEQVGSAPVYPDLRTPPVDRLQGWPEAVEARKTGQAVVALARAPDRVVVITAAAPIRAAGGMTLMMTVDTRDITRVVREERLSSFLVFLGVLALSLLLSFFLARTIVRPLRRLSIAAVRVRLGRAREVTVPRFVRRRDEIGLLARALSDMTQTLRQRMDATEAFAADVAHELKNPLASLRSAVETLRNVRDPGLQGQLLDVVYDDVQRIDRLITDIAEVSRLDAELAKARFEPVDFGQMVATLVEVIERQSSLRGVQIAYARPEAGTAMLLGDESRLSQLARNIVDNALSFSPDGGLVTISVQRAGETVTLRVDDTGPGIPTLNSDDIFSRFYSDRPEGEAFGKHSGLGLAIARAVAEAHGGTITAMNRVEGGTVRGARFLVTLPAAGL